MERGIQRVDEREKDRKREKGRVIKGQKEKKSKTKAQKRQIGNQEAIEIVPRIQEIYCKI